MNRPIQILYDIWSVGVFETFMQNRADLGISGVQNQLSELTATYLGAKTPKCLNVFADSL